MGTMRALWALLLAVGCALPAPHLQSLTPRDSTSHGGGHEFESLAVAALLVLVLIPTLAKKR
jgi:hypothetical protein